MRWMIGVLLVMLAWAGGPCAAAAQAASCIDLTDALESSNCESTAARIARVESRLLPAVVTDDPPRFGSLVQRMDELGVPGIVIATVDNYQIHWIRAYGLRERSQNEPMQANSRFQFASIAKPLTAYATLQLVAEGRLDLLAPVNQYLRGWQIEDGAMAQAASVTLEQLLSHTAGISKHAVGVYAADGDIPSLNDALRGLAPARGDGPQLMGVPGKEFRYSGGGYAIVQRVLEDLTGQSFASLMNDRLFKHFEMRDSSFQQPPRDDYLQGAATGYRFSGQAIAGKAMVLPEAAAGGLWSSADDVAKFVVELCKAASGHADAKVEKGVADNMLRVRAANMGLGVFVDGEGEQTRLSHGGSNPGFRSLMLAFPYRGQGLVVVANSDLAQLLIDELVRAVAAEYDWPEDFVERVKLSAPSVPLEDLVGRYGYLPSRSYRISVRDGELFGQEDREFESRLLSLGEDRFVSETYATELRFQREAGGEVIGLELRWPADPELYRGARQTP